MSKIKKKSKKKNYTLKKKRYSKRGGSSAVQPEVVEAEIVQPNQVVSTEIVQPNLAVTSTEIVPQNENTMETTQPNQAVSTEIVPQNENTMETTQPNQAVSTEIVPQNENTMETTQPNNSPEKKNGMSDDDSDEAVLVFRVNVNETCPTNYKSINKKQTKFCYKFSSRSDLIQNCGNKTPLEIDITPQKQKKLDSEIEALKREQNDLLTLEKEDTRLRGLEETGQELSQEDISKLKNIAGYIKISKEKIRAGMKEIVRQHGFTSVRYMIAGGLTMAVTLLLFPAIGVAAPGVGSAVFRTLDVVFKRAGNTISRKYKTLKNRKKRN